MAAGHEPLRPTTTGRATVMVCVGTYRRNEPLAVLIDSLIVSAAAAAEVAAVGLVVVDDNPDGSARSVADRYDGRFELGVHYRHVGRGNISLVRNCGLETGIGLADWVVLTDDDCETTSPWLTELVRAQQATDADTVTGPCIMRVPPGSPQWLQDQPFLNVGSIEFPDGAELEIAGTNNSLIRSAWLVAHPQHRFDPRLGVVGGEDMVFFRGAHDLGMRIRFAAGAVVYGNEPLARTTFRYRLHVGYWLGNTMAVTNQELGLATRPRLIARSAKILVDAAIRPAGRLARAKPPHLRFAITRAAQAVGMFLGAMGVRKAHH